MLKISRERVRQLCGSGALQSVMWDGRRLVSVRSVVRLMEERAKGVSSDGRGRGRLGASKRRP